MGSLCKRKIQELQRFILEFHYKLIGWFDDQAISIGCTIKQTN